MKALRSPLLAGVSCAALLTSYTAPAIAATGGQFASRMPQRFGSIAPRSLPFAQFSTLSARMPMVRANAMSALPRTSTVLGSYRVGMAGMGAMATRVGVATRMPVSLGAAAGHGGSGVPTYAWAPAGAAGTAYPGGQIARAPTYASAAAGRGGTATRGGTV